MTSVCKILFVVLGLPLILSCASAGFTNGPRCKDSDEFCKSLATALDSEQSCDTKDQTCDAARKAFEGGEKCTGWNDNDGLCLSFTQALSGVACFKDDPYCDSIRDALNDNCKYSDDKCRSIRASGISKSAIKRVKLPKK